MTRRKKTTIWAGVIGVLAIAFIGSVLLNIGQFFDVGKGEKTNPQEGTYICGAEEENAVYIVLTQDNEYSRYRQFQVLEEKKYTMEKDGVIELEGDGDTVLIYSDERLYFIRDGKADLYEKKSDTPTFVNVNSGS